MDPHPCLSVTGPKATLRGGSRRIVCRGYITRDAGRLRPHPAGLPITKRGRARTRGGIVIISDRHTTVLAHARRSQARCRLNCGLSVPPMTGLPCMRRLEYLWVPKEPTASIGSGIDRSLSEAAATEHPVRCAVSANHQLVWTAPMWAPMTGEPATACEQHSCEEAPIYGDAKRGIDTGRDRASILGSPKPRLEARALSAGAVPATGADAAGAAANSERLRSGHPEAVTFGPGEPRLRRPLLPRQPGRWPHRRPGARSPEAMDQHSP